MFVYAIEGDATRYREAAAIARIDELSGRSIGRYIIRTAIPSSARDPRRRGLPGAYVSKNGPGGFRVRRENATLETEASLHV